MYKRQICTLYYKNIKHCFKERFGKTHVNVTKHFRQLAKTAFTHRHKNDSHCQLRIVVVAHTLHDMYTYYCRRFLPALRFFAVKIFDVYTSLSSQKMIAKIFWIRWWTILPLHLLVFSFCVYIRYWCSISSGNTFHLFFFSTILIQILAAAILWILWPRWTFLVIIHLAQILW